MRKGILLIAVVMLALCVAAPAEARRPHGDVCEGPMAAIFNRCGPVAEHAHDISTNDDNFWNFEGGLDLILWRSPKKLFALKNYNTYSATNSNFVTRAALEIDLWGLLKGK